MYSIVYSFMAYLTFSIFLGYVLHLFFQIVTNLHKMSQYIYWGKKSVCKWARAVQTRACHFQVNCVPVSNHSALKELLTLGLKNSEVVFIRYTMFC